MQITNILQLYYTIVTMFVEFPRVKVKTIAERLGYVGRGKSPSTVTRHIQNMYTKKISREPRLTLRAFENWQNTAYFCKKRDGKGLYSTFLDLYHDEKITYALLLSGRDFFVTSREKELDLEQYGLEIQEKSLLYTPVYTMPEKWNIPMDEGLNALLHSDFEKGFISREVHKNLGWSDVDWGIYEAMRGNVRIELTMVARETQVYSNTVKKHFYEKILPCCVVVNYFFPKGYDFYGQAFLRVHTKHEESIVNALKKLPCTSYVFPFEKGLALGLFHEGVKDILLVIEKMEETGIIDDYLLYSPIASGF